MADAKASVVYPADGNVIGDWKEGEKIAQSGFGGRFNDKPDVVNGGNCYACHQMRPDELSYGTLGPSLLGYGKARNFEAEAAKAAYAKVYNAQAVFPCSQMPRFGYHKFLSEQQMKDVVALLFAKDSPVNK
jgi:sulfur-oxidizing protein SoxX